MSNGANGDIAIYQTTDDMGDTRFTLLGRAAFNRRTDLHTTHFELTGLFALVLKDVKHKGREGSIIIDTDSHYWLNVEGGTCYPLNRDEVKQYMN